MFTGSSSTGQGAELATVGEQDGPVEIAAGVTDQERDDARDLVRVAGSSALIGASSRKPVGYAPQAQPYPQAPQAYAPSPQAA